MITEEKKQEILRAIDRESSKLGSDSNVAKKLGISTATISANLRKPENWDKISEKMWADIAAKLGVNLIDRGWKLAKTKNTGIMTSTLAVAQREALFMAVSEKAGSGKSASISDFVSRDKNHSVYNIQCEEWSPKSFLINLATTLGVTAGQYDTAEKIMKEIVRFFKHRAQEVQPLLILDEADKLRPAAKRFIIPLYNKLEDQIGLVCVGTENLEKEIKEGVRRKSKGYDEIDSRLGRNFIHLVGYEMQDLKEICRENGVVDPDIINQIWRDCEPTAKKVLEGGREKTIWIIEDARLIKRKITRAKIRTQRAA